MAATDRANAHKGPDLQPMREHLPNTSTTACRELVASILAQAVASDDREWALAPEFGAYCRLVGLSESAAFVFKVRFLVGALDRRQFLAHPLQAARWGEKDPRAEVGHWSAWPTTSPLGR